MFAKTGLWIAGEVICTFVVVRRAYCGLMSLITSTGFARCLRAGRAVRVRTGQTIAEIVDHALEGGTGQRLALLIMRHSRAVSHREAFDEGDGHGLLNRLDRNIYVRVM
jgi:hypothetical protein